MPLNLKTGIAICGMSIIQNASLKRCVCNVRLVICRQAAAGAKHIIICSDTSAGLCDQCRNIAYSERLSFLHFHVLHMAFLDTCKVVSLSAPTECVKCLHPFLLPKMASSDI